MASSYLSRKGKTILYIILRKKLLKELEKISIIHKYRETESSFKIIFLSVFSHFRQVISIKFYKIKDPLTRRKVSFRFFFNIQLPEQNDMKTCEK